MAHFSIKVKFDGFDDVVIYNSVHRLTQSSCYDEIIWIDFSDNDIHWLPRLPDRLREMICCNCKLNRIKDLPDTLLFLNCSHNGMTSISSLPPRLKTFGCAYNQLSTLPDLPKSLEVMWCNNNNLVSFDRLPNSLEFLHCQDNPRMKSYPPIPYSMDMNNLRF